MQQALPPATPEDVLEAFIDRPLVTTLLAFTKSEISALGTELGIWVPRSTDKVALAYRVAKELS